MTAITAIAPVSTNNNTTITTTITHHNVMNIDNNNLTTNPPPMFKRPRSNTTVSRSSAPRYDLQQHYSPKSSTSSSSSNPLELLLAAIDQDDAVSSTSSTSSTSSPPPITFQQQQHAHPMTPPPPTMPIMNQNHVEFNSPRNLNSFHANANLVPSPPRSLTTSPTYDGAMHKMNPVSRRHSTPPVPANLAHWGSYFAALAANHPSFSSSNNNNNNNNNNTANRSRIPTPPPPPVLGTTSKLPIGFPTTPATNATPPLPLHHLLPPPDFFPEYAKLQTSHFTVILRACKMVLGRAQPTQNDIPGTIRIRERCLTDLEKTAFAIPMSTVMKSMEEVLKISVDEDVDLEHVAIVFNPVMERFELIVLSDLGVLLNNTRLTKSNTPHILHDGAKITIGKTIVTFFTPYSKNFSQTGFSAPAFIKPDPTKSEEKSQQEPTPSPTPEPSISTSPVSSPSSSPLRRHSAPIIAPAPTIPTISITKATGLSITATNNSNIAPALGYRSAMFQLPPLTTAMMASFRVGKRKGEKEGETEKSKKVKK